MSIVDLPVPISRSADLQVSLTEDLPVLLSGARGVDQTGLSGWTQPKPRRLALSFRSVTNSKRRSQWIRASGRHVASFCRRGPTGDDWRGARGRPRGRVRHGSSAAGNPTLQVASVKALVFDTFGTVVDWRTSVTQEVEQLAKRKGLTVDGAKFADAWRAGYRPSMDRVRTGELPWTKLDRLHRMTLDRILDRLRHQGTFGDRNGRAQSGVASLCGHGRTQWLDSRG